MSLLDDNHRSPARATGRSFSALLAGTVFGAGLAVSDMTNPLKVLAFLDVAGPWDASLLFVMGGAVLVAALGFWLVQRRPAPLFDTQFPAAPSTRIDGTLIAGAAMFGIGWGLGGYCPGPAVASLGFGNAEALWFVPAMLAGAGLQRWQARRRQALGSNLTL